MYLKVFKTVKQDVMELKKSDRESGRLIITGICFDFILTTPCLLLLLYE